MRLFRLTFATILQRKAWVICVFAVLVLPFALPMISSATEKPILVQPARILAAWSTLWVCALFWGLFTALFLLVMAPLLALATALASRFGGITGFTVTLLITVYGLYGVGYLESMLKVEANPILHGIWTLSPHYSFADLTQRLVFKTGALPVSAFINMTRYFGGILAFYVGLSRLCFRTKLSA